ncbi:MAG: hypothetical protein JW761_13630, partial [Prolixibacteraceae bacterium]|nr:hypothetical protein [Prolixibacteraceae bacterium]
MKKNLLILFMMFASISFAQQKTGVFQFSKDIGNPELKGSASYDENSQEYTLKGAGYNIWFERD